MSTQLSKAPAKEGQQDETLAVLLKRFEPQIRAALPAHLKPERMLSIARTAISVNPGLQDCTPLSVIASIVKASRLGLECDSTLGEAHLVPRWNSKVQGMEAVLQIGYQGKVKLCLQSGEIDSLEARVVYEGDYLELEYTPALKFLHRPVLDPTKRGEPKHFYLYVRHTSEHEEVFLMTRAEVDAVRDRFGPKNKAGEIVGPWTTDYIEMGRKTVIHRGTKHLPKSTEHGEAVSYEARIERGESPEAVVLDVVPGQSANAQVQAATEARQENLKARLEQKRAAAAAPTAPAGEATQKPFAGRILIPAGTAVDDAEELPDCMGYPDGHTLIWRGAHYTPSAERTGWVKGPAVEEQAAQRTPSSAEAGATTWRRAPKADAEGFNFGE